MLADRYYNDRLSSLLIDPASYRPYPLVRDPQFLHSLPAGLLEALENRRNELEEGGWPLLLAHGYLDFTRTGERAQFQLAAVRRRNRLAASLLSELVTREGRFVDDVIDGIWLICEESSWVAPAHNFMHEANESQNERHLPLPDISEPQIDLISVETAAQLALTADLLSRELDSVTPLVRQRVEHEIHRRIIDPFLDRDDFWWMGFKRYRDAPINNWNPWCASRILMASWLVSDDPLLLARVTGKVMRIVDVFIDHYPADGSCDEGPNYWSMAAGALFDALVTLSDISADRINVWKEPLLLQMAEFIGKVHIAGDYYVNFADAKPIVHPDPAVVYEMGRRFGNDELIRMSAAIESRLTPEMVFEKMRLLQRTLGYLEVVQKIRAVENPQFPEHRDVWLEQGQIVASRARRLYFAAKGGHNDESHNHNDVGSFVLYGDEQPLVIDVGVGTYTHKTFDPQLRYTIWTMQSSFHNLPDINGHGQYHGRDFQAERVDYAADDTRVTFTCEIGGAWQPEAGLESFVRTYSFERSSADGLTITDTCSLSRTSGKIVWHFMLPEEPVVREQKVVLREEPAARFVLTSDEQIEWSVERISPDDDAIVRMWGPQIYRLNGSVGSATSITRTFVIAADR